MFRQHNYPVTSSTILFPHLWIDEGVEGLSLNDFYNDVYTTCEEECGKIRSLQILDNNIPYLQGNVFVSFEMNSLQLMSKFNAWSIL